MDDCIFCKIVKGEIPSYKIYEDDNYLAFLDIANIEEGHTLVIPKEHHRFVWDDSNIGEYFKIVQKVANHYKTLGYKFVDSMVLGRMVPHAHVHIIPHNSGGDWGHSLEKIEKMQMDADRCLTQEDGERICSKFKLSE